MTTEIYKSTTDLVGKIFELRSPLTKVECWNRSTGETGNFAKGEKIIIEGVYDADRMTIFCPDDKDGRPITSPDGSADPHPGYRFVVDNSALCLAIGVPDIGKQYDLVGNIMAYENDEMNAEETVEFFQHLIDHDLWQSLQGHYGRMVNTLVAAGHCKPKSRLN